MQVIMLVTGCKCGGRENGPLSGPANAPQMYSLSEEEEAVLFPPLLPIGLKHEGFVEPVSIPAFCISSIKPFHFIITVFSPFK